jgi:hypothetical protein
MGYLSSMMTLSLEVLAERASTGSFVHNFPGSIQTGLLDDAEGYGAGGDEDLLQGLWTVHLHAD